MNRPISPLDRVIAETLSVGSKIFGNRARAGDVKGFAQSQSDISFRWRHGRIPTDSIQGWVEFEGNETSGWTPPNYKEAGILFIDKRTIDQNFLKHGGKHAVAYALGTTVMLGYAKYAPFLFAHDKQEDDSYILAAGIGRGSLIATAGIITAGNEFLVVPGSVTKGPRMAASEVPKLITQV